ncbi:MAG: 4-hydroxy-tetrahydrodipicolinate reductase [Planctomycetes bacterium]|nr:4-hydroxy-tetrahydrodipicolinate reductase [Planctomycetota bacterium]
MKQRVAVIGAQGRLGRFACALLERSHDFELVARVAASDDLEAVISETHPVVALDVTRAGLGCEHGLRLIALGVRPVIGTSGVSLAETRALDEAARARGLGGLVVPNFSLGMSLLQRAAVEAAQQFEACEIIELHHDQKRDAPSGTALDTAERMRAARGAQAPEIPIHSVRLAGLYAHQVVIFGSAGETYTLRHDMSGPEGFGEGIGIALTHALTAVGVGRGLSVALGPAAGNNRTTAEG